MTTTADPFYVGFSAGRRHDQDHEVRHARLLPLYL